MPLTIEPSSESPAMRAGRCPHCRTRLEKQEGGFLFVKNAIIKVDLKTRLAEAKCPQCKRWVEVPLQLGGRSLGRPLDPRRLRSESPDTCGCRRG